MYKISTNVYIRWYGGELGDLAYSPLEGMFGRRIIN